MADITGKVGGSVGRGLRAVAATLTVAVIAAGCTGGGAAPDAKSPRSSPAANGPDGSPLPAALTGQKLDWGRCEAPASGEKPGSKWECATMKAPLDYDKPAGKTLDIALIRTKASQPSSKIGSLIFNFGGPGGSGVQRLPSFGPAYTKLNTRYDLVSFDPRGVAASQGVRCRTDAETEQAHTDVDLTPDTPAEEDAYFQDAADFGAGCARDSGDVLPHVRTSDAARDMDLMRQVLGDKKLHYFGFSYGTQLGGVYAHLFPKNVGRLVLDAVVDPDADMIGHAKHQTRGFQRALDNYLKSTGADPRTGTRELADLLSRIDREPLRASGDRELNENLATTGIVQALYSEHFWPTLTKALYAARKGDGSGLLDLADQYNDRDPAGRYSTAQHSQRAISCSDTRQRPTPAEARKLLPEFQKISPVFGPFLGWDTAGWCHKWPVEGEHDTTPVSAPGAAPILVVGTTGDSATPFEGSKTMATALGDGVGIHLTHEGEGHGAYGSNLCVNDTIEGYLLDHKIPESGKVCS
ncbi:alpha/beta hydrolase [Streptomyces apocyni]|uniref:alpha/beta hydrolase n=1 Tax=Streptomyces apocyni TaxID=2654677 RepID=UPI0012EAA2EA|nr:alpha/beta hydrolase [Streptomyces apocyni]